jgi:hypothetical protein
MKKITFIIVVTILFSACSGSKRIQKNISKGDYDRAIQLSVKKLKKNISSKNQKKYAFLLENAFMKAVEDDNRYLNKLFLDTNPSVIEQIYETYISLDKRQNLIRPLLPLKRVHFNFVDYNAKISNAKIRLTDYLYETATQSLAQNTKQSARAAYDDLKYLDRINPNFKDVNALLEEAHYKGINFISVELLNETNQIIPRRLEDDLLAFSTNDLNTFWTIYHSQNDDNTSYDYKLQLLFKQIDVSPERIHEKKIFLEKEVKDGFEYVLDANGNVATDSLGRGIKVDKYIVVSSDVYEVHQEKASHIYADVLLVDLISNQTIETIPLESEFIFIHDFAEMDGDRRALNNHYLDLIKRRELPFPSNEQMIFDTGEDLKNKLKAIIDDFKFN